MIDLILKDTFELSGDKRTNTMKLRPNPDGSIQVWIKNGYIRHAAFRLQADTQKELMDWLNKHSVKKAVDDYNGTNAYPDEN